jgi:hypothetical protein
VLKPWTEHPLADLLATHGLTDVPEVPFPSNGWSGARLTSLDRPLDGRHFILKRTSLAIDWIARSTRDEALREGFVASLPMPLPEPLVAPYFGAGGEDTTVGLLMPDLSNRLVPWDGGADEPPLDFGSLERILDGLARLHAMPWSIADSRDPLRLWPAVPWRERLLLLSPSSGAALAAEGVAAGERFTEGWACFARQATPAARALVARLDDDPRPLLTALSALPRAGLHGDLKLANVCFLDERRIGLIDWQMIALAPVSVELGWMLVTNSASLPEPPESIAERYRAAVESVSGSPISLSPPFDPSRAYPRAALEATVGLDAQPRFRAGDQVIGDWDAQLDLTWIIGLLLRGWRKGIDAESGATLGSGVSAADDLAWWCSMATEAAGRRL